VFLRICSLQISRKKKLSFGQKKLPDSIPSSNG